MNEKLSTIVVQFQKLVDALIDEATASLVDWDLYQSSYTFVKRILATPNEEFGDHSNHLVHILSKRHEPFKKAKIRVQWFSCGGNVRTYKNQLVQNGIEVRSCDNMEQSEITKHLQLFRDSLPSIVSSLIGPDVWRKASFSDLPLVYQSSWHQSIEYAVFYKDAKKSRSTGSIYIAKLPFDVPYIHYLVTFYGVILRRIIYGWSQSMPHAYIYDKRVGFVFDKKNEAEARSVLGLPPL